MGWNKNLFQAAYHESKYSPANREGGDRFSRGRAENAEEETTEGDIKTARYGLRAIISTSTGSLLFPRLVRHWPEPF
jgi:hypothetical protein